MLSKLVNANGWGFNVSKSPLSRIFSKEPVIIRRRSITNLVYYQNLNNVTVLKAKIFEDFIGIYFQNFITLWFWILKIYKISNELI